ncbi:glycerophosphoryl diester phosphodiesterase membrane domain-containing protein [Streptomyces sp. NPDC006487]|uniref:glycerophosphoryl diester phosphodiesterase membrane domain-containing protein n=1 Tax=Streptomyces sp. NPDC006487 TaxID=3364748 RepID=UPI003696E218
MNDSPGWATPGSSPSDGEGSHGTQPPAGGAGDSKWSAEQPPPGQWSSPTPGQTPPNPQQQPPAAPQPGAGWGSYGAGPQNGGQGGGQGGWGPHTQAAKPGVIPLRPLGLGEILDGAVSTMRKHWRTVLPITLVVAVLVQLVSVFVQKYTLDEFTVTQSSTAPLDEQLDALGSMVGLMAADQFILLIGTIVATAMLTMIYSRAILGHGSSVGAAWREARPQLARLFGLTLLLGIGASLLFAVLVLPGALAGQAGLAVLGGFVALGLILWLWIRFSLASPALMLEKATVRKALVRSSKLVKGSWWRIFGITVLTAVITFLVSGVIVFPLTVVGGLLFGGGLEGMVDGSGTTSWGYLITTAIGGIIALAVTVPIQAGVTVLLYVDQRIRREALDLELARAAGIENYGTTTPPTGG